MVIPLGPLCDCEQPCTLRKVSKDTPNKGRCFWGCADWPQGCGHFEWASADEEQAFKAAAAARARPQPAQRQAGGPAQSLGSPGALQTPQQPQQSQQPLYPSPIQPPRPAPRYASPLSLVAAGKLPATPQQHGVPPGILASQPQEQQLYGSQPYNSQPQQQQQQLYGLQPHNLQPQQQQQQLYGSQPHDSQPQQQQQQLYGSQPHDSQPQQQQQQLYGLQPDNLPPEKQQQQLYGSQPHNSQPQQQQQQLYGPQPYNLPPQQQQQQLDGSQPQTLQQPQEQRQQPTGQQPAGGVLLGGLGQGPQVKVTMLVVDDNTCAARFHFNEPLKDFLKALPRPSNGRWNPQQKVWTFPMDCHDSVVDSMLQSAPVPVAVTPITPQQLARAPEVHDMARLPGQEVDDRLQRLPGSLWSRLYAFQRDGVRRGVELGGRCLLADEMGLGKTVQALCIAACFAPEDWPLLIVCPSTMKPVWRDAVHHWLPPDCVPEPANLAVINEGKKVEKLLGQMDPTNKIRVCIVSFDMAKKLPEGVTEEYKTIIVDESHNLKNLTTQRTGAVGVLVAAATRAMLVTGTPALSRPVELFPQINMLRPGLLGTLHEFGMRYCGGHFADHLPSSLTVGGYDFRGASNLPELHSLLQQHLMIRRLKKDVLADLPDKIRKRIPIDVDPAHTQGLQQTKQDMKQVEEDERAGAITSTVAAQRRQQLTTELYRRTGPAKVKDATAHVLSLLDAGEKVLIFAHHQAVLDGLQEALRANAVAFVRIDGQVGNDQRKAAMDAFQRDRGCRAALLSITAAGVGITLTEATVCCFVELFWNPGQLVQCEDRAHRLGQEKVLEVHYLLAAGTADDTIWELCKRKLGVVGDVLGQEGAEEAFGAMAKAAKYVNVAERQAQQAGPQQQQQLSVSQSQLQAEPRQQQQRRQQAQSQQQQVGGSSGGVEVIVLDSDDEGGQQCFQRATNERSKRGGVVSDEASDEEVAAAPLAARSQRFKSEPGVADEGGAQALGGVAEVAGDQRQTRRRRLDYEDCS